MFCFLQDVAPYYTDCIYDCQAQIPPFPSFLFFPRSQLPFRPVNGPRAVKKTLNSRSKEKSILPRKRSARGTAEAVDLFNARTAF